MSCDFEIKVRFIHSSSKYFMPLIKIMHFNFPWNNYKYGMRNKSGLKKM